MHPVAFELFGREIRWYGIMAAVGFMLAVWIMQRVRDHAELNQDQVSDITLIGMIGGILGARIFYVIEFWDQFQGNYIEIIRIDKGGLVFYGGFILALFSIIYYCMVKRISVSAVLDICAPAIALGHASGRIGCFLNGCCYGDVCHGAMGVVYPAGTPTGEQLAGVAVHPVQLYEVLGNCIICFILIKLLKKLKHGQTAAIYLVLYGVLRFIDEFFRGDHTDFLLGFTPAQSIGILLIPSGIIWFLLLQKFKKQPIAL